MTMTAQEVIMMTLTIDGNQYQVPSGVVSAFKKLETELKKERKATEQATAKYKELSQLNSGKLAKRIMYNLADGNQPKPIERINGLGYAQTKYDKNDSCLRHNTHYFPAFEEEVLKRIIRAIDGRNNKGEEFRKI